MAHKNISFIAFLFNIKMQKVLSVFGCLLVLFSFSSLQAQNAAEGIGVELEQQVFEIARKVRCPVCRAESAADSNAATSIEFRNIIQEKLEEGQSEAEIIAFFQASYGDWILLDPPKRGLHLVVWLAPLIAAILALVSFFVLLRRWTRKANSGLIVLTAEELEQVRNALKESALTETDNLSKSDDTGTTA